MIKKNGQLVVFKVGRELYASSISDVKEIINLVDTSKPLQTSNHVKGIADLRGNITVIYDLGEKFYLGFREYNDEAKIIVLNGENIGFIVDEVKEIIHIDTTDIDSSNRLLYGNQSRFVEGFIKSKDNIITILNLKNMKENQENEKA